MAHNPGRGLAVMQVTKGKLVNPAYRWLKYFCVTLFVEMLQTSGIA
jgi:hypothetical protein